MEYLEYKNQGGNVYQNKIIETLRLLFWFLELYMLTVYIYFSTFSLRQFHTRALKFYFMNV